MAEPGAGSAGRGAAGAALITYGSTRQYGYRPGKRRSRAGDGNRTRAISLGMWAVTLFPRGFDQVIPQILALLLL
jgi:hypothetical protein